MVKISKRGVIIATGNEGSGLFQRNGPVENVVVGKSFPLEEILEQALKKPKSQGSRQGGQCRKAAGRRTD